MSWIVLQNDWIAVFRVKVTAKGKMFWGDVSRVGGTTPRVLRGTF